MTSQYDGQVVTLLVEEGRKPSQPVASYMPTRRERYLVFLPDNAPVGQQVRVKLVDTDRIDSRGMPLFRGEPAVEYKEIWKDNGDGTASLVTYATTWLGNTSEDGERDTRPLGKREGTPSIQHSLQVVWGQDLATSAIEDRQIRLIPLEEEKVEGGQIVWQKVDERKEPHQTMRYDIIRVEYLPTGLWASHHLEVSYQDYWGMNLNVFYRREGQEQKLWYTSGTWGSVPNWMKRELESRYPVCACGRQRRDAQVADGYGKCELCRAGETCIRCGQKPVKVKNFAGRLICNNCEPYEVAEQLINRLLPQKRREAIAAEAKKLRSGQALVQAEGEVVLKATVDHITDRWTRDRVVQRWTGYGWYYFADDGVYGTKLAPAALLIIEFLPHASGNGLVELVAWLALGPKPGSSSDYYTRTQVKGERVNLPPLEETIQKLAEGKLVLADRLRGSEPQRRAALEAVRRAKAEAATAGRQFQRLVSEAESALQSEEQNYALVLEKIAAALAEQAKQQILADLLACEYNTCPVCGEAVDWTDYHDCERQEDLRAMGSEDEFPVKVTRVGEETLVEIVAWYAERWGAYRMIRRVHDDVVISDPSQVVTKNYWRKPSKLDRAIREAEAKVKDLQMDLAYLLRDQEEAQKAYTKAEEDWLVRAEAMSGMAPIEVGTIFLVKGFRVENNPRGGQQLVYGPDWDEPSRETLKLVLDPFTGSSQSVAPGSQVLVQVRPRSSSQLHLFKDYDKKERKVVTGYFVQVVMSPKDFEPLVKEAEEKLAAAEARLTELRERGEQAINTSCQSPRVKTEPQELFDTEVDTDQAEEVNPDMVNKLRKAGVIS